MQHRMQCSCEFAMGMGMNGICVSVVFLFPNGSYCYDLLLLLLLLPHHHENSLSLCGGGGGGGGWLSVLSLTSHSSHSLSLLSSSGGRVRWRRSPRGARGGRRRPFWQGVGRRESRGARGGRQIRTGRLAGGVGGVVRGCDRCVGLPSVPRSPLVNVTVAAMRCGPGAWCGQVRGT
jgi:hypothetical protein